MSEPLQSGYHPDADQLSAFVERTLPPHEQQQTLAHLAICPECRSIVSLSLPAMNESPKLRTESSRTPWFFGWNLVWPASAVLAGVALFLIHVHNASVTRSNIAAPPEVAASHPPEPLPAPVNLAAPASGKISSPSSGTQSHRSRSSDAVASHGSNPLQTNGVINGNAEVVSKQLQAMFPNVAAESRLHGSINGDVASSMGGTAATHPQNATDRAADQLQQSSVEAASVNSSGQPTPQAPAGGRTMTRQGTTADATPTTADGASLRAGNQTVDVTAGDAPVAAPSLREIRPVSLAAAIASQHPLPSQLPVLSVVSSAFRMLAIDAQNTLFFSEDGGSHWKAIPSQWQGRAVKVDLASAGNSSHPPLNRAAIGGLILSQPKVTNSALTGTVKDPSGAVIPNASIVIRDATAQNVRTVTTDRTGRYVVDELLPGNYKVEAQAPGFNTQQVTVTVAGSQQSVANVILEVGQAAETVTVEASAGPVITPSIEKKKAAGRPPVTAGPLPLFEITTDTGDHWTSVDGLTWTRK